MASTKQTKSSSTRKTGAAKSGSSRSKKTQQSQRRPIRREVGGLVLGVLALCVLVSYCGISAIFIDWFAVLIKGLLAMATGWQDLRCCWQR